MAARTISELANWDGHLDQQRQSSKRRPSSSIHTRNPYQTSHSLEASQPSNTRISEKKRAGKSSFHPNLARVSTTNTPTNTRRTGHVDTTSTPFHDMHDDHPRSISRTPPTPALPSSPFTTLSFSSVSSPLLSVPSRVNSSRTLPSLAHVASSQPTSQLESDVIDLTLDDTEEGPSVSKKSIANTAQLSNHSANPVPRDRSLSSAPSSPILPEQSLFTPPPPPKRRTRLLLDYLRIPPLPDGLTKADYQPISRRHDKPLRGSAVASIPNPAPLAGSQTASHSPQRHNGKERHRSVTPSNQEQKPRVTVDREDLTPSMLLDEFYEPVEVPIYDDDTYPPLTARDLATNSRFQFAHAWRAHAAKLQEAELEWTSNPRVLGNASILARSSNTLSPRIPGTTGYVSIGHLRPWELVLPKESTEHASDGQAHEGETYANIDVSSDHVLLPDDALPTPNVVAGSALSNSTVSLPSSSVTIDAENDMNQYFNGLGDSPDKHMPSHQQVAPTNAFRSHLLQSAGRADVGSFDFGFSPLALDPQPGEASGQECFLGVPPSPTTADTNPLLASASTSDSLFGPSNHITPSPSITFATDGPLADAWSFEQGECPMEDKSHAENDVLPTATGTINPSLLGQEQLKTPSVGPKHTQKRRANLPEPVIYIRRPIDSSALPRMAGKRPVQIKYRDPGASSASPSTRNLSNKSSLNHVESRTEPPTSDADEPVSTKRQPVPSRKLREACTASDSGSDFVPDTSESNIKLKIKRSSLRDKEAIAQEGGDDAVPPMSYCHQCRNKSVRPKMMCSNVVEHRVCGKRFCNRCILHRYPDITFDEHSAGFLCPVCTNTCNCSYCSRNRGEEFISMRLGGQAASIFKSKVTLVRDSSKPPRPAKSPDEATQQDRTATQAGEPVQPRFWAHVYGVEGERVGSAFMPREQIERLHAPSTSASISAPALLSLPEEQSQSQPRQKVQKPKRREKKRERPTGPRIFIGRPLASWKIRRVRDLEPSEDMNVDESASGKGKGKARGSRSYIGNAAALFEPYGRMPGSGMATPMSVSSRCSTPGVGSDRSLTPLAELAADDWPQPEVGEGCEWAPRGVGAVTGTFVGGGAPDLGGPSDLISGQGASATDLVHADGEEASTPLSPQDLMRAISAGLAAVTAEPSSATIYP